MSKLTFSFFLRKLVSESDVFGKKNMLWINNFEKKTDFESLFLKRLRLLNKLITSYQSVYWISTYRQNLNQDFNHALGFNEKDCFEKFKICWKTRSQRSIYLANIHRKVVNVGFFVPSWKICCGKKMFSFKKKKLDQTFWK